MTTGKTQEEAETRMREAIEFHFDGLGGDETIPEPRTIATYVEVAA